MSLGDYKRTTLFALVLLTITCTSFLLLQAPTRQYFTQQQSNTHSKGLFLSRLSQYLFPDQWDGGGARWNGWITHNQQALQTLFTCLENEPGFCPRNRTSVVILASTHLVGDQEGYNGGEDVWARSTIEALDRFGYTYLYSPHFDGTLREAMALYRMFPNLVKMVISEVAEANKCFYDARCILSERNPYGIPAWKLFAWQFWEEAGTPLGHKWTLNPEDYTLEHPWTVPNTYLGYSIEPWCSKIPFIPHEQRAKPGIAYLYGKKTGYFKGSGHAWNAEIYREAAKESGAHFVVSAGDPGEAMPDDFPTDIVESLGNRVEQHEFYTRLSGAAVVIGAGWPRTSPTFYDALCFGTPVINPIREWNASDPTNRDYWVAQHGTMKELDPPFVYNVFQGDKQGFIDAVKKALENPIDRFILDRMRMSAVEERLAGILETDWRGEGIKLLEERKAHGGGPLFSI
ncbi:hypothetical protein MKEN_00800900 [Mycena kentingensis (nom. inval.)]|nr:hypothetical protein MKEN_00800900 [Mycena kentingensis (nom. inval.)]